MKFKILMKVTPSVRKVLLSSKAAMGIQCTNDLIWERTKLKVARFEGNARLVGFHECRIASLESFIADLESMTPAGFKQFVKEHGKEIF